MTAWSMWESQKVIYKGYIIWFFRSAIQKKKNTSKPYSAI